MNRQIAIMIIMLACIYSKHSFSQASKRISYGVQLGMVAYEKAWNAYAPTKVAPLYYSSIDLLPVPKIGFMSEFNFNKLLAIDFSPAIVVHHTYTHGETSFGQNNSNLFTLRTIELPVVVKFNIPVTSTVKWTNGAGIGIDYVPKGWQMSGPISEYWDSYFNGGGDYPSTVRKQTSDQLMINKSIIPAITLQTGLDIKLKNKGGFYMGVEAHLQTKKNFRLTRKEVDLLNGQVQYDAGSNFNTNYFLVKVGYWLRKK